MDQSHLDQKYFIDSKIYNCPFCNRRHVRYFIVESFLFDWSSREEMLWVCGQVCLLRESLPAPLISQAP